MENILIELRPADLFVGQKAKDIHGNIGFIEEIQRELAIKTIIENHYSKKVYNGTYINLGVFENNKLVGVLQYGYAMNPASCGSVVKDTSMDEYLELNRMWLSTIPRIRHNTSLGAIIKN